MIELQELILQAKNPKNMASFISQVFDQMTTEDENEVCFRLGDLSFRVVPKMEDSPLSHLPLKNSFRLKVSELSLSELKQRLELYSYQTKRPIDFTKISEHELVFSDFESNTWHFVQ